MICTAANRRITFLQAASNPPEIAVEGARNGYSRSDAISTGRGARGRRKTSGDGLSMQRGKMAGAVPKLKLLCLHGYMQNAEVFRSRLGSMRKALKSRVEFVFVEAPFEAQGFPGSDDPEEVRGGREGRSWWQWMDAGTEGRPSKAASYKGWEVAQASLLEALRQHQPDGLLGFSQGAAATALLLSHLARATTTATATATHFKQQGEQQQQQQQDGSDDQNVSSTGEPVAAAAAGSPAALLRSLKCAILVAGFLPRDPAVAELIRVGGYSSQVPMLFITGTSDTLIPPERTAQLWDCFNPAKVSSYTHGGAHHVPTCSGQFKSALVEFLDAAVGPGPVSSSHLVQQPTTAVVSSSAAAAAGAGTAVGQQQQQQQQDQQANIAAFADAPPAVGGNHEQLDTVTVPAAE